ncbi:hypothetical protein [uncultured Pseudacidovorax sp.]|uniref:hypothetical protein n=1 Tax=uncultured Pseudacidovorax sp. TaxID=679313 RepID=UPI0025D60977|nr:hypothetical protein [uncultured Pseudacidovorax sp.]
MRPAGEVRQALLDAALALTTPERSPTQLELAMHAQVGFKAARATVQNMVRSRALVIVRLREVDYRPRPVAEYCPASRVRLTNVPKCELPRVFAAWATSMV